MVRETVPTDMSAMPELSRLAHEVAVTGKRHVLIENGAEIAVVSPAARRRRSRRPQPFTRDDSLWSIVGIIKDDVPADVSSNKHKYLAQAYMPENA